jgi:hypothetical protein
LAKELRREAKFLLNFRLFEPFFGNPTEALAIPMKKKCNCRQTTSRGLITSKD